MPEFVTLLLGRKNVVGDWIITERVEVQAIPTDIRQIVITPRLDRGEGYNLSHVQSGRLLLGPFSNIPRAKQAAEILATLFPIEDWDALGEMAESWRKSNIRKLWARLTPDQQAWMRRYGAKL